MTQNSFSSTCSKRKRSRLRVPTSCTACRRRKMKCDKARPSCSSCNKGKNIESCVYEDHPWTPHNEVQRLTEQNCILRDQVQELRRSINGPNRNTNEMVFDHSFERQGKLVHSTHSVNATSDPIIDFSKSFRLLFINQNLLDHQGPTSYIGLLNNDSYMSEMFSGFLRKQEKIFHDDNFLHDEAKFHSYLKEVTLCPTSRPSFQIPSCEFSTCINIAEKVNEFLPKGIIFAFLLDHFFSFTYNLFPFVDEDSFRSDLKSIISLDFEDKVILKIKEPRILSTVALLLIILRMAFISLPLKAYLKEYEIKYNTLDTEFVNEQFRKEIHIGPSFIELAKDCLSLVKWLQTPSLKIIQTLLMLKVYRKYAPEDADETADSSVILSAIIQLARIHGLHRDPKHFSIVENRATRMTWRKIWHALLFLDAEEAYIKGYPLLINDEYDTELPENDTECSHREQIINKYLALENQVTNLMRNIVKICTIKIEVKRSEIEVQLELIEDLLKYKLKSIESIISYENLDQSNSMFVFKSKELVLRLKVIGAKCVLNRILNSSCENLEPLNKKRYKIEYTQCALVLFRMCARFAENPLFVNPSNSIEFFLAAEFASLAFYRAAQPVFSLICESSSLDSIFLEDNIRLDAISKDHSDTNILKAWLSGQSKIADYAENLIICFEKFLQFSIKKSKKYFRFWRISVVLSCYHDFLSRSNPTLYTRIRNQLDQYEISQAPVDKSQNALTFNYVQEKDILEWKHFVNKSGYRDFDYTCATKSKLNKKIDLDDPYFKDFDDHLTQPYNEDYQKLQTIDRIYLYNVDNLLSQLKLVIETSMLFKNNQEQNSIDWDPSIYDFYHSTYNPLMSPTEFNTERLLSDLSGILFDTSQ